MFRALTAVILISLATGFGGQAVLAEENGKTALITGANRGIGLELAKQLMAQGYKVIGTARKPAEASELKALGAHVVQLDVSDSASVASMASALDGVAIDLLINNAGTKGHTVDSFQETDWDQIGWTFNVNSIGPMRVTQALLPNLLASETKTIVQISSVMGSITANRGGYYGYRASKAALNMFNKSLALELADEGVIAVVMHPGWVKTRLGGEEARLSTEESVSGMVTVISQLQAKDNGRFYDYKGEELPW